MGSGIAQLCAISGANVTLCDVSPEQVKRTQRALESEWRKSVEQKKLAPDAEQSLRKRITFCSALTEIADADLVIEAVTERMEIKQELFTRISGQLPPETVLATNTHALSVTALAAKAKYPERVAGLHFLNPVAESKIVEIIDARQTSTDVLDRCVAFIRDLNRQPILVQDSPGFAVTRCTRPFFYEALHCFEEGIADYRTIDEIMRIGGGFTEGPFERMDRIGLDQVHATTRALWEGFFHDPRFRPHLTLRKLVEAGDLGKKTGRGFYEHRDVE